MLKIFQVDAFTDRLFGGNPAAVVPLESWIDDKILQAIAAENNLAETAYIVPVADSENRLKSCYELRWFTPASEVALCGHATLATAYVLIHHLGVTAAQIDFITRQSGTLTVEKKADGLLAMSFPSIELTESSDLESVSAALGATPKNLFSGNYSSDEFDYVAVFETPEEVARIEVTGTAFTPLRSRGVIVTAASETGECDFVSRYFAPNFGIDEDPVTGSAHCLLAPYWAGILGTNKLRARQISPRGGNVGCEVKGDRTVLTGSCVDYLQGEINVL